MAAMGNHTGETARALGHLEHLVVEGLKHGHFDLTITCVVGKKEQRELVIKAGRSHKFVIPANQVPK